MDWIWSNETKSQSTLCSKHSILVCLCVCVYCIELMVRLLVSWVTIGRITANQVLLDAIHTMCYSYHFIHWIINYIQRYDSIRADNSGEVARNQNINISDLLDQLLLGYDNHIRPDFGGIPQNLNKIFE